MAASRRRDPASMVHGAPHSGQSGARMPTKAGSDIVRPLQRRPPRRHPRIGLTSKSDEDRPCAPVAQLDRASGFEPEGRGFESLPACHFKLGHRVPEESRFELRSRGFDLGAQRRVESLPACQWNQGVRRFFEIAFLGLGRFGPSKASKFGERFEELFGVSYGAGWCHFAP